MFAGHFGLAAAAKAQEKTAPLWAYMLGSQLLDVFFVPLYLAGVETIEPVAGASGYGASVIHADYTHSLLVAVVLAVVAGLLAMRPWGRTAGLWIGGVVFSHWVLDLLVHRSDLPILPGNAGNLPLLGFGLWATPAISIALEAILVLGGAFMYFRAAMGLPAPSIRASNDYQTRALTSAAVTAVLLIVCLVSSVLGFE